MIQPIFRNKPSALSPIWERIRITKKKKKRTDNITYVVITAIPEATSSFLTTAHVFCTNFFCLSVNPVASSILLSSDDESPRKRRNVPMFGGRISWQNNKKIKKKQQDLWTKRRQWFSFPERGRIRCASGEAVYARDSMIRAFRYKDQWMRKKRKRWARGARVCTLVE